MFKKTLDEKPLFTKADDGQIRDLTQSAINNKIVDYLNYDIYKVPKEFAMRPDLISQSVYNTADHAEIILKFNAISNPFSINENDIILIPDLNSALAQFKTDATILNNTVAEKIRKSYKYIDKLKIPTSIKKQSKYNNRSLVDAPEGALPPNFAEKDESQLTYTNGRVFFGVDKNNATVTQSCLKNGMSSAEFLTKVIKRTKNG